MTKKFQVISWVSYGVSLAVFIALEVLGFVLYHKSYPSSNMTIFYIIAPLLTFFLLSLDLIYVISGSFLKKDTTSENGKTHVNYYDDWSEVPQKSKVLKIALISSIYAVCLVEALLFFILFGFVLAAA
jgi:hypothetical protein